ncbi:2-hydroxyacyl-CoA dehydratase subunit D [Eggerthella sinensis]|uniref:2-hydroxyacyl-CoA dehydratase n=1 Tax=Eggerthella sinensis TaxID=242230 RepID=A0A3N0ITT3_9ACTN|nr:2-hydroxyacyl-CoA dehydratase family protein [Eggerthella sinensis]RDB68596.1 2-hydroxyacyl-CoA dehydratase [Eggerthella sinensis]RNM40409.1 2-hydroxyacyl-CoA dehydratase [Eggerthella sinensis]
MSDIKELLAPFAAAASNPSAQVERYVAEGKRIIGVGPYYVPEELVHAGGGVPFGVWGMVGPAVEAKKYFPPFFCSICQMTLEMGLTGKLDQLSGMMITGLCDNLRPFSQNWSAGVGSKIPMIFVSQPQNRAFPGGRQYAIDSYTEVKRDVEECLGTIIEDDDLRASIALYNEWRAAMRTFVQLAGQHPAEVSVTDRVNVINAGYYLLKDEHLPLVRALNEALAALPSSLEGYKPIVLSGIYEDIPSISAILEDNKFAIVADDLAKESRAFALQVPEEGDPVEALADGWCALKCDSVLFDPHKDHCRRIPALAQEAGAAGVVILMAKFCDPEEYDEPITKRECKAAGVPVVTIEVDQSTETYGQARTQLETFAELIG